jgi:hypothetical protein
MSVTYQHLKDSFPTGAILGVVEPWVGLIIELASQHQPLSLTSHAPTPAHPHLRPPATNALVEAAPTVRY